MSLRMQTSLKLFLLVIVLSLFWIKKFALIPHFGFMLTVSLCWPWLRFLHRFCKHLCKCFSNHQKQTKGMGEFMPPLSIASSETVVPGGCVAWRVPSFCASASTTPAPVLWLPDGVPRSVLPPGEFSAVLQLQCPVTGPSSHSCGGAVGHLVFMCGNMFTAEDITWFY